MRSIAALILALVFVGTSTAHALEAGAAIVDITPPLGSPLSGYGDRLGRGATEVHDPLTARCLYLRDEDTQLFLVTTDLCIINRELRTAVLQSMPATVPPENVILTATHNHNGTGGMVPHLIFRTISGPYREDLLDLTAQGIVQAMEEAYEKRTRATIAYGTARQEVLTVNRQNPDGPRDEQIGVIKVEDPDGLPIAIIGNMAAHPTSIPKEDRFAISADYPGYFYTELEKLAGEGCVAMFMNGAEGNQTCANPEGHSDPWARTESIGRLLAIRVKEVANRLNGDELPIDIRTVNAELPPTLANRIVPNDVFLQTLQIGGLILTFFPGEPCVEIGLEMRRRAKAAGFDTHFTVGLANDHLLYFVPKELYATAHYESQMSLFGPEIEDWFYDHFEALMKPDAGAPETIESTQPNRNDIITLELKGTPRDWGVQRGRALGEEAVQQAFELHVAQHVRSRAWLQGVPFIDSVPQFLDLAPVTIPLLGIAVRERLAEFPLSVQEELAGIAAGADVPYDVAYLLQLAPLFAANEGPGTGLSLPFCTMAAIPTEEGIKVARTFDWVIDEPMSFTKYTPEEGIPFITAGPAWNLGAFSGMNAAGLTVVAERVEGFGNPDPAVVPIEFRLRELLASPSLAEALAIIETNPLPAGYATIIADTEHAVALRQGEVVELAEAPLLAIEPNTPGISADRSARYQTLSARIRGSEITEAFEVGNGDDDPSQILNAHTRFLIVFDPISRAVQIHAPTENGTWDTPKTLTLDPGITP